MTTCNADSTLFAAVSGGFFILTDTSKDYNQNQTLIPAGPRTPSRFTVPVHPEREALVFPSKAYFTVRAPAFVRHGTVQRCRSARVCWHGRSSLQNFVHKNFNLHLDKLYRLFYNSTVG